MSEPLDHDFLSWTRADFPLLERRIDGHPLRHLDSAATAPKPRCVIEAVTEMYREHTANVHRGVHVLSEEATEAFEGARQEVASLLNAAPGEIIFTRNATEAINLVANGLGLEASAEVLITAPEHHSNFLPWGVRARAVPLDILPDGLPRYDDFTQCLGPDTRLAALAHVSNTLGVVAPVEACIAAAHGRGVPVLVDASQSAGHLPIDVRAMDCDFLVFSGHKLLGPSGVGVLYGKRERLETLALYQVGGGMVSRHGEDGFATRDLPWRFEAGTPNVEGVVGLGAAIAYLRRIGMEEVRRHSQDLGRHLVEELRALPGLTILADSAPLADRIGLASFHVPGVSQESVARRLCDRYQTLVSAGQHCAHLLHQRLKIDGTVRASTQVFNTREEIDYLIAALREIISW